METLPRAPLTPVCVRSSLCCAALPTEAAANASSSLYLRSTYGLSAYGGTQGFVNEQWKEGGSL